MKRNKKGNSNTQWVVTISIVSVVLSASLSFLSGEVLGNSGYIITLSVLLLFIMLGIVFDMIGVAVTAADARPFHSMAAHKEKGGKEAIYLIKNSQKVSSICNDVVGDICGIVSGTTAAIIVLEVQRDFNTTSILISIIFTAIISGLTIGGKAIGKIIAINDSTKVVHFVAKIMYILHIGR